MPYYKIQSLGRLFQTPLNLRLSIKAKMVIITALIFTLSMGIISYTGASILIREYTEALYSETESIGQGIKLQLDRLLYLGLPLDEIVGFEKQCREVAEKYSTISHIMVMNIKGEVLFSNDPVLHGLQAADAGFKQAAKSKQVVSRHGSMHGGEYYGVTIPVLSKHDEVVGAIQLCFPEKLIARKTTKLTTISILTALVCLGLTIGISMFAFSIWIIAPLNNLLSVMLEIRKDQTKLHKRAEIHSQDEIGQIAGTFNEMLDQLQISQEQLIHNIAEIKKTEKLLKSSLIEKEVLLKEIHHRVKNNMQVVTSLLSLQANKIKSPQIQRALNEAQGRVRSMALVHDVLYKTDNLANIGLQEYLEHLIGQLRQIFSMPTINFRVNIMAGDMTLNIDEAVPFGLIVTELFTNTLKYAFSSGDNGVVDIIVKQKADNSIELLFSDNGAGMPADIDASATSTMGLRLVTELVEEQLEGRWHLDRSQGVHWTIQWLNANRQEVRNV